MVGPWAYEEVPYEEVPYFESTFRYATENNPLYGKLLNEHNPSYVERDLSQLCQ